MGFFGEVITSKKIVLEIPDEYSLHLLQVCLDISPGATKTTSLLIKTQHEEKEFILCHLGPNQLQYSLSHVLGPEDGPVTVHTTNGATVHLTGKWTWELGDDFEGCNVCDESALEGNDEIDDDDEEGDDDVSTVEEDEEEDDDDEEDDEEKNKEEEQKQQHNKKPKQTVEPAAASRKRSASIESASSSNHKIEPPSKKADNGLAKSKNNTSEQAAKESTTSSSQKVNNADKKKVEKEKPVSAAITAAAASVPLPQQSSLPQRKKWKVKPQNDEGIQVPQPKALTRTTGIVVTDFIIGKGAEPKPGAKVKITYEGSFPDGSIFDERPKRSKPFVFRKGTAQVIRGLDLGLEGMRIGGAREIIIPSELGYGKEGMDKIPGNQTLIFRVCLVGQDKK